MSSIDPDEHSAGRLYRLMTSMIVPRPIAWVGTRSAAGLPNLAPFSYFMGVSAKPFTVAISVARDRDALKDTARNILETKVFTLSLVSWRLRESMVQTSGRFPPEESEFEHAGLTAVDGLRVAAPYPSEAPISMECRLVHAHDLGSTHLFVGEALRIEIDDALVVTDERGRQTVSLDALDPLARLGGQDYARVGTPFTIPRPPKP